MQKKTHKRYLWHSNTPKSSTLSVSLCQYLLNALSIYLFLYSVPFLFIYNTFIHLTGSSSCHSPTLLSALLTPCFISRSQSSLSVALLFMFSHSLITCQKNVIFFSTSSASGSFVRPFLARLMSYKRYFIPFSLFLPSYTATTLSHPLPSTPPPSILLRAWQKTHTPLSPSLRPPYNPTSPAHWGQRRRKRKRKSSICLSEITDCHLGLTMSTYHP